MADISPGLAARSARQDPLRAVLLDSYALTQSFSKKRKGRYRLREIGLLLLLLDSQQASWAKYDPELLRHTLRIKVRLLLRSMLG
jgi:hypothetical protein